MIIKESFLIFYIVWYWAMCVLYKDNMLPNKLENLGHKFKKNTFCAWFFLGLSECKFCMNFWSSSIGGLGLCLYWWDYQYLFWGIFCSSITAFFEE